MLVQNLVNILNKESKNEATSLTLYQYMAVIDGNMLLYFFMKTGQPAA